MYKNIFGKCYQFFSSKLATSSFVLRQVLVKTILTEARPRVLRDLHNLFGLPMFSVNYVLKTSIGCCQINLLVLYFTGITLYYLVVLYCIIIIAYPKIWVVNFFEIFLSNLYSLCSLIVKPVLCVISYSNLFYRCNSICCVWNLTQKIWVSNIYIRKRYRNLEIELYLMH